jgi:hypothetical protein
MRHLSAESLEPLFTYDFRRREILKLGGIGTSFFGEVDQGFRTLEIPIMIRGNIGDEVRRVGAREPARSNRKNSLHLTSSFHFTRHAGGRGATTECLSQPSRRRIE